MKKLFVLIPLLAISFMGKAQEPPMAVSNGFTFPIGSKFTIKLIPVDSTNFNFSVVEFEEFDKIIESFNYSGLFDKTGNDSTITFYFCFGTHGKDESEKKKNMKVHLLMKNYTHYALNYKSEIQRTENGKYESTSNIGLFPGIVGNEMWPYMIHTIGLREFRKRMAPVR